jgi:redox-sensitive bicupin YhaK (pirin superfamily)
VKIICGRVNGTAGPVRDIVTEPEYLDVSVPAGAEFSHPIRRGHTAFAYVIAGEGYFDPSRDAYAHEVVGVNYFDFHRSCVCGDRTIIHYGDGDEVVVSAPTSLVRFLLISGRPIGEPVAWYGPIVMNTQEELQLAFEEYQEGTFIKHAKR